MELAVSMVIPGVLALVFFLYLVPVQLWIQALTSGASVGIIFPDWYEISARSASVIVKARIIAHQARITVNLNQLESHYMAGGNVMLVVQALVSADRANIELTFDRAAAIDLAGRNVLEAVKMSVLPRVITTPKITAMAKDGIQVSAFVKVTVRANLDRLVGGATEETILARVGEGVVTTIGSSVSHKDVLENPDFISRNVLTKGLTRERRLRSNRLILPMSMSDKTSGRSSKSSRLKPISKSLRLRRNHVGLLLLRKSKRCLLRSIGCVRRLSKPKRWYRWLSLKRLRAGIWELWIITTSRM